MMAYAVIFCVTKGEDKQRIRAKMSELRGNGFLKLFADSFFALLCPIIVLGGIYSGIVTPTEAACVSVFYALFVSLVVYRSISLKDLIPFLASSVKTYGGLAFVLAFATAFGRVLSLTRATKVIEDFIVTNFANGDVIGHTQNTAAKIEACGHVSRALEKVVGDALSKGYVVAVTADHGNIEKLYTAAGKPDGAHTTNLVPFVLMDPADPSPITLHDGSLGDVAPTVLDIMGIPQPPEMTGRSLAEGKVWGKNRKMLLIICDGWGLGTGDDGDAIHLADTPYWDSLLAEQSWSKLHASGEHVGLGTGKAGNSEAGHSNLGAGRCVMQDDVRLDAAVKDGSFQRTPAFLEAVEHVKKNHSSLHLISYLTYKSSHGCIDYPLAICRMAKEQGLDQVYLHIIFDGRSTEPGSAPDMLSWLDGQLEEIGIGRVVDGVGRGVALDRDKNYDKVKRAYDAMVDGTGAQYT